MKTLQQTCLKEVALNMYRYKHDIHELPKTVLSQVWEEVDKSLEDEPRQNELLLVDLDACRKMQQAHPNEFLSSVWLNPQFMEYHRNPYALLTLLENTQYIQLPHCDLGDEHALLPALGDLPRLLMLDLSANSLTDVGLNVLVTGSSSHRRRFPALRFLDLKDNEISVETAVKVSRLLQFPGGEFIVNSLPKFEIRRLKKALRPYFQSAPLSKHVSLDKFEDRDTEGWARCLIRHWEKRADEMQWPEYDKRGYPVYRDSYRFFRV